jgi:hypothetical protein
MQGAPFATIAAAMNAIAFVFRDEEGKTRETFHISLPSLIEGVATVKPRSNTLIFLQSSRRLFRIKED